MAKRIALGVRKPNDRRIIWRVSNQFWTVADAILALDPFQQPESLAWVEVVR